METTEKRQRGRPCLPEEERERRVQERKMKARQERLSKKKEKDPSFKPRTTYDSNGRLIHRNYVYKTVKTPDMTEHEYMTAIIDELINMPIPIDSKDSREFQEYRKNRIETGIDESEELFEKEIDKWPLPQSF